MQQYNRLELAFELSEAKDLEEADALAAEQGLFIERKEFIDNLQIKKEIITVRECRNKKIVIIRYVMHCRNKHSNTAGLNQQSTYSVNQLPKGMPAAAQLLQPTGADKTLPSPNGCPL